MNVHHQIDHELSAIDHRMVNQVGQIDYPYGHLLAAMDNRIVRQGLTIFYRKHHYPRRMISESMTARLHVMNNSMIDCGQ